MISSFRDRKALLAVFCIAVALYKNGADAFVNRPSLFSQGRTSVAVPKTMGTSATAFTGNNIISPNGNSLLVRQNARSNGRSKALRMSADDFNQEKYTEAAWAAVSVLTKAAEYYQSSQVEAPLLLDILMNPGKHGSSENGESARRVTKKVLEQAGVDVNELRSALETHLSKQPKMTDQRGQKIMGRDLPKVLESARTIQSMLGDSFVSTEGLLLALIKEDTQFTRAAIQNQGVKYQEVLDVVKKMREKSGPTISRGAENMYDALMKYGIDFTEKAKEGKLE